MFRGVTNLLMSFSGSLEMSGTALIIPSRASDPTGAVGMIYYDTTNNRYRAYDGAWKTVTIA